MTDKALKQLEAIKSEFENELNAANLQQEILNLKSNYLGKKGPLSEILKSLKDASNEERKTLGQGSNELKKFIQDCVGEKLLSIERVAMEKKLNSSTVDISTRENDFVCKQNYGAFHPVNMIQREVEDIFLSMGFDVLDGPHIEDDYHNFEALNIPSDHPARDMQDTFWFKNLKNLLRTHTSTIQVRGMKERTPPFRFIAPGKVFRCERTDAFHESAFHQLEGMMVGKDISVSHLIYFMKQLLKEIFQKDIEVRLRPGFFPFVEPGFELDIKTTVKKEGKLVEKWLELLPCGMVHPNVLKHGGIDPNEYQGFAFGLGLDRLVMMRYEIDDIRHLHSGDLRFIEQFRAY